MTEARKSVLRTVRLDDEVWAAVKAMDCSLNQYLRQALLDFPEHLRSVRPDAEGKVKILRFEDSEQPPAAVDNRPKNAYCKHCGNKFAGAKFATICPNCKSSGHTLMPAECPACNDGRAI